MKRIKQVLLSLIIVMLLVPSFLSTATANDSKRENVLAGTNGEVTAKDEVVYATLSATGDQQQIYVVNTLEVEKAGTVVDYGSYSNVKNLSDLSEVKQNGDQVEITSEAGKFFYQGNLVDASLPWDIAITYFLDGKKVSPEALAGKDGHVEIRMETAANEKANPMFAENYLLQISVPLDSDIFSNIQAEDGMIASVGKNKQVTFTVMPENEGDFLLEADVVQFELAGIDITGVPSSMAIDAPDVDEMTGEMKSLADAIAQLNDGVAKLKDGVSALNNGVADLRTGSKQYKDGIRELDGASAELVTGSAEIGKAFDTISSSLQHADGMDVSQLNQLAGGLTGIADGLFATADGLATFKGNYTGAFQALDGAITKIPAANVTENDIQALYASGADPDVVGKLVDTYIAAQTIKATYAQVKPALGAVDGTLAGVIAGLNEMATNLQTMAGGLASTSESMEDVDQLAKLLDGIASLSANYKAFHTGVVSYTNGVGQLSRTYAHLHDGIEQLSDGTKSLDGGVDQLHDGTKKLHDATSDLPEQMQAEIDKMIAEYDKSDFEAVSFVSDKNERVNAVQFVLKTESIKDEKQEVVAEPKKEKKGFWARLVGLFR